MEYFKGIIANKDAYLSNLKVMHAALCLGQLFFLLIATFLISTASEIPIYGEFDIPVIVTIILFSLALVMVSVLLFNKRIPAINQEIKIDKIAGLKSYRSLVVLRWALLEAAALSCIISFLLSGSYWFVVSTVVIISIFVRIHPSKLNVMNDTNLSNANEDILNIKL